VDMFARLTVTMPRSTHQPYPQRAKATTICVALEFAKFFTSSAMARPLCLSVFAKSFRRCAVEGASCNQKERRSADTG
jgi:hypothetical protein